MLKEFLSERHIQYRDRDVTRDQTAVQELMSRTGQMAVPVIIIDGQTIIGFDRPRLEQALSQYSVRHPGFGAAVADASRITAAPVKTGAYVGRVRQGTAAERLGLTAGDVITSINGQAINSASDMENLVSRLDRGSRFSVTYNRHGQTQMAAGTL